jgi:polygalacturonase
MKALVVEYGAAGDGRALDTAAIQAAVDACAAAGGGTVVFPAGVFVTGTVELKSHVTLCLEQGAVLRGSSDMADYPPKSFAGFKNTPTLLYAVGQTDIRLTGEGEIDLNDEPFMDWDRRRVAPEKETGVECNETQRMEAVVEHRDRPDQPILFHDCRRVRLDGITIRNAPAWFVSVSACRDVKVHGVTIDGNPRVPNNDGIHFSSCRDVIVSDCVFSCGDDCIAVTGIRNWEGVSEGIAITNCTMVSRSAAIRLGHLRSKVRDVAISNVVIRDSNRGIGIFAGDGGFVEDVTISNLVVETRLVAGAWWGNGEPLVISAAEARTGRVRRISVSGVRARSEHGIVIVGEKGNVHDVELRDWTLPLGYGPNRALFKPVLDLAPATMRPAPDPAERIPWLYAEDASGIRLSNVRFGRKPEEEREFSVQAFVRSVAGLEESDVREINFAKVGNP